MTRILFVDDEPKILDGLKRMLRSQRHKWDMAFVDSGDEALKRLASERFDIIVTDMRMPGMDGAQLLTEVRRLHPHMVRIILSGHSDQDVIMKSVRPAHQYLAKPCEPEKLLDVLSKTAALRNVLPDDRLQIAVSRIEALPALPSLHESLVQELNGEGATVESVARLVARDMGMTAMVLKLVNSAFFALSPHVATPKQAVGLLGLDVVKALVVGHGLFSTAGENSLSGLSFQGLWRHSLATAAYARRIVESEDREKDLAGHAFTAGLLHDVGKLILATVLPREYAEVLDLVRRDNRLVVEAEREVIGTTHGQAGGYLLGLWGIDTAVVTAVAHHNQPSGAPAATAAPGEVVCLAAVHVADVLERNLCVIHPEYVRPAMDRDWLASRGLAGRIAWWEENCQGLDTCGDEDGTD